MALTRKKYEDADYEDRRKNIKHLYEDYLEIVNVDLGLTGKDASIHVRGLITAKGKTLDFRLARRGKWTRNGIRISLDGAVQLYTHLQTIIPMLQAYDGPGVTKDGSVDLSGIVTKNDGDKIDD